jgi:hypothetical protein
MLLFLLSQSFWTAWKIYYGMIYIKNFIFGHWLVIVKANSLRVKEVGGESSNLNVLITFCRFFEGGDF